MPRLPDLIKVPEPQPPKRPPAPGYDMKTLRRQLEFLTQEMDDRTRSQQQVNYFFLDSLPNQYLIISRDFFLLFLFSSTGL